MISDLVPVSVLNVFVKYADDLTAVVPELSDTPISVERQNIVNWSKDNKKMINLPKTKEAVIYRNARQKCKCSASFDDIELIECFKLLGVFIDCHLNFNVHVTNILNASSQRLYLLKLLQAQGLSRQALSVIYEALVVNKVRYCISAWGGFINNEQVDRFNSLFRRAKRYGYSNNVFDFNGLLFQSDSRLFKKLQNEHHCIHHLLPSTVSYQTELRERGHNYPFPFTKFSLTQKSFIPRVLRTFS